MHLFGDDHVIVGKNIKCIGGNKIILFEQPTPKLDLRIIPSGDKDDDIAGIFDHTISLFKKRELLLIGDITGDKEIIIHFCLDGIARLLEVDELDLDMIAVSIFES